MLPCLDAAGARSVVEVGAFAGDLTRLLVDWADARRRARDGRRPLAAGPACLALDRERPELELIRATSLEALPAIALPDAVIIDGDHNYYTVSEELRIIGERAPGAELPLLLFHDVCWPHGAPRRLLRRPSRSPRSYRQPIAGDAGGICPGRPRAAPRRPALPAFGAPRGRPAQRRADRGRGLRRRPRGRRGSSWCRCSSASAWSGTRDAPWSDAARAGSSTRWDRNPVLERLEANRVHHLAQAHRPRALARAERQRASGGGAPPPAGLERVRGRRAAVAAARPRGRRHRAVGVSKDEIRRALDGLAARCGARQRFEPRAAAR